MAIAFDAASETFSNSTLSLGWSHTCTGSDRILWVYTMHNSANTITGVTYNGVSMTSHVTDAQSQRNTLWYLVAPATGANTVTVTLSGSASFCYAAGASYTGAAQTSPTDGSDTSNGAAVSTLTSTITTTTDNDWCILGARQTSTGDTTASTNCTERAAGASGTIQLYDSNGAVTPAGSFSMTTTQTASATTAQVMAAFKPAVSVSGISGFFAFF